MSRLTGMFVHFATISAMSSSSTWSLSILVAAGRSLSAVAACSRRSSSGIRPYCNSDAFA